MLLASGSVRNETLGPIVLFSDLCECFPYDDAVYMVSVSGAQLKHMIKYMLRDSALAGYHSEFYQLSNGLHVVYNRAGHSFVSFEFNGEPVEENSIYRIGLQKFHFINFDDFFDLPIAEVKKNGSPRAIATSCRGILDEYLSSHQNLDREVSGRLVIL